MSGVPRSGGVERGQSENQALPALEARGYGAGAPAEGRGSGLPLATLLADRDLGLRPLTPPTAPDAPGVLGVHASEMPDPTPYLLGGELLLTAGAGADTDATEDPEAGYDAYVTRLVAAGTAALGFGLAPVHEEVPPGLTEACARHGLPLVEVPPHTPFTAVARAVWRLMARARTRELRRVTEAQQALAAAAARPTPVPAVLARLAASLGGYVTLRPDGRTAGSPPPTTAAPHALPALEALLARVGRPDGPATATDQSDGWHLAAHGLGGGRAALGTATPTRTPGDHTVASVAAVLLTLLTADRTAGPETAALTRLLLDGDPSAALGPGPWYAVHARGGADPAGLAAALDTVLMDPDGAPAVRLLTDRDPLPQPGWRLGVSTPAAPDALAAADAEAARALERAEAARAPLARHADTGFAGLIGAEEGRIRAEALLAPLSPERRTTLRAWLAHHGSWDRTAAALGVHRNTVRQRVTRCAALLARDLDDPDTRTDLWLALRFTDPAQPPS
ncbi:PucR family transcriptional regulator [Streptomyces sp. NPDC097619]|uniref:PucR family transcriptional regulator n=1 Tax=Streptomyces sp. NPDC097619 TaxID=3157228 RepID=UPI00331B12CC